MVKTIKFKVYGGMFDPSTTVINIEKVSSALVWNHVEEVLHGRFPKRIEKINFSGRTVKLKKVF